MKRKVKRKPLYSLRMWLVIDPIETFLVQASMAGDSRRLPRFPAELSRVNFCNWRGREETFPRVLRSLFHFILHVNDIAYMRQFLKDRTSKNNISRARFPFLVARVSRIMSFTLDWEFPGISTSFSKQVLISRRPTCDAVPGCN